MYSAAHYWRVSQRPIHSHPQRPMSCTSRGTEVGEGRDLAAWSFNISSATRLQGASKSDEQTIRLVVVKLCLAPLHPLATLIDCWSQRCMGYAPIAGEYNDALPAQKVPALTAAAKYVLYQHIPRGWPMSDYQSISLPLCVGFGRGWVGDSPPFMNNNVCYLTT